MSTAKRVGELNPPERILMGPGPSNVHWRVYRALSTPVIGHLDPNFLSIMDEISEMLRALFKTQNRLTIPMSGTGSLGMETCFVNVVEPGDEVVIGVNGVFGERMCDVASRCGAEVIRVEAPWGRKIEPDIAIEAVKEHPRAKVMAVVHAETSTGVMQPLREIGEYLSGTETLFLVDAVTSLAGIDLRVDEWRIDLCYSATQKCLSVPPGLAPVTLSEKAVRMLGVRKSKVQSWYLDLNMIGRYWGKERVYHHTAPISMLFGLREALRVIFDEGLERRFARHLEAGDYLKEGLLGLGWGLFAEEGARLPMLTAATVPAGFDDAGIRGRLLGDYGIEVGAGLGATKGKIWRIGLMGETARRHNVDALLSALRELRD